VPAPTAVGELTKAEPDELDTCHSNTPPDTEGVNATEILFRFTVVAGHGFTTGDTTEMALGVAFTVTVVVVVAVHPAAFVAVTV
jgi:hypothetical protein